MDRLRVLEPAEGVLAFYDGRVPGHRFADYPNWVDDGAISLGIASYALVVGETALIYDTHVSAEHGRFVREALESLGVGDMTVVLSHWHLDHVAGTEAFADCEVIASTRTTEHLSASREAIESGELEGPPPIDPLVLPTRSVEGELELQLDGRPVRLITTEIHSDDATLLWLQDERLLLCGDTMEDTVTYVDEPERLDVHLANLAELRNLGARRILPNHGDPATISAGGYETGFIEDTSEYIERLLRCGSDPELCNLSLREFVADLLEQGQINYFEPYERVHEQNVERVLARA
ncbi:MAG TPA: MBL fold metallo-hydrolase [Solirubrobacterales bacterium]|nr:MBL fold metallo-hydrolase [Solirubrobacterales bacterium]